MAMSSAAAAASGVPIRSLLVFCARRSSSASYAALAKAAGGAWPAVNSSTKAVSGRSKVEGGAVKKEEEVRMKEPETGKTFVPENRLDEMEVIALIREKFLPRGTPF